MKVLILGKANHGKDTVAELLHKIYGLKFSSSSMFVLEKVIYPALKDKYGYTSEQECYEDRVNHRKEWHDLIHEYNSPDLTKLTRELLEQNDIYVGLRNMSEYLYTRHLYDLILWVDADQRVPADDESLSIRYDSTSMERLDNNESVHELVEQILELDIK